jgi:hypothetical protein
MQRMNMDQEHLPYPHPYFGNERDNQPLTRVHDIPIEMLDEAERQMYKQKLRVEL